MDTEANFEWRRVKKAGYYELNVRYGLWECVNINFCIVVCGRSAGVSDKHVIRAWDAVRATKASSICTHWQHGLDLFFWFTIFLVLQIYRYSDANSSVQINENDAEISPKNVASNKEVKVGPDANPDLCFAFIRKYQMSEKHMVTCSLLCLDVETKYFWRSWRLHRASVKLRWS